MIGLVTNRGSIGLVTASGSSGLVTGSGRVLSVGVCTGGISLVRNDNRCDYWGLDSLASGRVVGDVTNSSDPSAVGLKAVETH